MTGTPQQGAAALPHRAAEAVRCLGVRVVLLGFWGTAALLSRWGERARTHGGESVHRKA
ncbi:hypothetical protein ACIOEW_18790 [Streptomyces sp. NPDC087901]|uniref:hypothetical protein n=1 Tax=Streptomyces sp. NPDC087901 TaxID=3365818 RepID=UPI003816555A